MSPGIRELISQWLIDNQLDFTWQQDPDGTKVCVPNRPSDYQMTLRLILINDRILKCHYDTDICVIKALDTHSPDFFDRLREFLNNSKVYAL